MCHYKQIHLRVFNSRISQLKHVSHFLRTKRKKSYIVFNVDRLPQRVGLKQGYYLYIHVLHRVYELGRYISGIYGVKGFRHIGQWKWYKFTMSSTLNACVLPIKQ